MTTAMDIGTLRERVSLQSATDTVDAAGQPARAWATYSTVWARVEPLSAMETQRADQQIGSITHRVTVRYLSTITNLHRVLYGSRALNIRGVTDTNERHYQMILDCEEKL